jgi:ABC-type branched-subunit amino acid transport system substrate-binding protein
VQGRRRRPTVTIIISASLALFFVRPFAPTDGAEALSPLESRGAVLYHDGASQSGPPVFANVGSSGLRLPGTVLPCAGCHGPDGRGRPEGGVDPVPVTWEHLTKAYGHRHAGRREHPAFTEATLKRAITAGVDPGGNQLDPAMPRYEMATEDLEALIAYMKHLGRETAPGVTATTIVVGVLVPGVGPLAAAGSAAAAIMQAYVDEINAQAGVYGRSIVLRTERLGGNPASAIAAVDRLIDEPVFALVGAIPSPLQPLVGERVEVEGVPLFHLWPPAARETPDQRLYGFYLLAGLKQEALSLVEFVDEQLRLGRPRPALVVASPHRDGPVVEAVKSRWADAMQIAAPTTVDEARRIARKLRAGGIDLVCVLARHEGVAMLLDAAAADGWFPYVLVPGSLAGGGLRQVPRGFGGKVFLAYPVMPRDRDPEYLQRLEALRATTGATSQQMFSEAAAFVAVSVLVEGLRSGGRGLTRDALVAGVEKLYLYRTGLTPPLTYGPNRRIGAAEARIVRAR